jgi:hypothetical protein
MLRYMKSAVYAVAAAAATFAAMTATPAIAQDKQPIKIGFGMAETGPLGPNGKSALTRWKSGLRKRTPKAV